MRSYSLLSISFLSALLPVQALAQADDQQTLQQQLNLLKAEIARLEARIAEQEEASGADTEPTTPERSDGIRVGGAVRTNFSHTSYNEGNKNRGGDLQFDIFRLNLHGAIGEVSLDAEIRFFDYMTAVKYAYVGYQFHEDWQVQAGITPVPFGNKPYNSHNYFFSTNYYIGLEDDHDLGIVFQRLLRDNWQLDLGFLKNDELGGIDGYVSDRSDRYSYDVVGYRQPGNGLYDAPSRALGEYNTLAGRFAYQLQHNEDNSTELGMSVLDGGLHDEQNRAGGYQAWAVHANSYFGQWNLQFQHGEYRYRVNNAKQLAVGAYAFYDTIAAEAKTSTFNLAYSVPVTWGPVTGLQFYNNYGLIHDKVDGTANTMMNVTGVSVAAGGLFTYFDLVHARNQPFIGGSIAGDSSDTERRFNINIGYYF